MKETMLTYIKQEREVLTSVIDNRRKNLKGYLDCIGPERIDSWVVLATGSSANAMLCAKYYVEKIAKVQVDFKTAMPFIHYDKSIDSNSLVFAVSQSGRSYSTIKALEKAQNARCFTLTSNYESPIARLSRDTIDIGCGEEKVGYVTKGFSATVLTFMLIGLETALTWGRITEEEYTSHIEELRKAVNSIDNVLGKTMDWYETHKSQLISCKHFIAIGYGPSVGVINEFDTKFTETIRVCVNAHELEEYMHGPYLGVKGTQSIIFIETDNGLKERQDRLKKYLERFTNNCYKITYAKQDQDSKSLCLSLGFDELIMPILMVVPIQYLAYIIAVDIDSDFETDKFSDFGEFMGSKIQGGKKTC